MNRAAIACLWHATLICLSLSNQTCPVINKYSKAVDVSTHLSNVYFVFSDFLLESDRERNEHTSGIYFHKLPFFQPLAHIVSVDPSAHRHDLVVRRLSLFETEKENVFKKVLIDSNLNLMSWPATKCCRVSRKPRKVRTPLVKWPTSQCNRSYCDRTPKSHTLTSS